jgi:hypothetical protein
MGDEMAQAPVSDVDSRVEEPEETGAALEAPYAARP